MKAKEKEKLLVLGSLILIRGYRDSGTLAAEAFWTPAKLREFADDVLRLARELGYKI